MKTHEKFRVKDVVQTEGLDYGLKRIPASDVSDPTFHVLKENYFAARKALCRYIDLEDEDL